MSKQVKKKYCTVIPSAANSSELRTNDIMAPALLSNGQNNEAKKSKLSTKQNKMKMDPDQAVARQPILLDVTSLKAQLAVEDEFISNLLSLIPKHGPAGGDDEEADDNEAEAVNGQEETVAKTRCERVTDPEELKERLVAKLSQFQGKKMNYSGNQIKNKLKRKLDKLEKKKLKRKNSKRRSKIAKLAQDTQRASATSSATVKTETFEPVQSRPPKPIFNSEGRMVFSKFDFGELTAPTPVLKKTTNDPKAMLQKIKKVKEKLQTLAEKGETEKVQIIQDGNRWNNALQRAEGLKVKDNEEMLAKSVKRKEHKKKQSKKQWEERIQNQEKRKEDAQKKRKTNIKARKDKVKQSKLSLMAKRGKIIL